MGKGRVKVANWQLSGKAEMSQPENSDGHKDLKTRKRRIILHPASGSFYPEGDGLSPHGACSRQLLATQPSPAGDPIHGRPCCGKALDRGRKQDHLC